jgi:hypothetical protein
MVRLLKDVGFYSSTQPTNLYCGLGEFNSIEIDRL